MAEHKGLGDRLADACTVLMDAADAMFTKDAAAFYTGTASDLEVLREAVRGYRACMNELNAVVEAAQHREDQYRD